MRTALLTVHGEATDHLSAGSTMPVEVEFELPAGLRDLVQSTGIPHVEIGAIEVNEQPGTWSDRIDDGDRIVLWSCYPNRVRDPRFLLDVHLGKLARLLRLLGLDAASGPVADDLLAEEAARESRVLLSRDRGILMRSSIDRGRWIRSDDPETQAAEVIRACRLEDELRPFTRCLVCGGMLQPASPESVSVPPEVRKRYSTFASCAGCRRPYWEGTHHRRLAETVGRIRQQAAR